MTHWNWQKTCVYFNDARTENVFHLGRQSALPAPGDFPPDLALVMPFQQLFWLAPPAAILLQSATESWVQYWRISLSLLDRLDTWGQVTWKFYAFLTWKWNHLKHWKAVIAATHMKHTHTHTHLHLQSDPSSRRRLVLRRSQEATFPLLLVLGGTCCPRFTRTSTSLINLNAEMPERIRDLYRVNSTCDFLNHHPTIYVLSLHIFGAPITVLLSTHTLLNVRFCWLRTDVCT